MGNSLKISYIMPDFDEKAYSGGLYVIFQHCNGMLKRGHEVRAFNNTGKKSEYLRLDLPVEIHKNDPSVVESNSPDIIVGTYWHTYFFINRMKNILRNNTKLCFLIQGDDRLVYDDLNRPLIYRAIKSRYMDVIPIYKIVVSRYLQDVLKNDFGEESIYIRNGLDSLEAPPLLGKSGKIRIAARYDTSSFRGWDVVDKVLRRVSTERDDAEIHLFEMKDKRPTAYKSFFHKGLYGESLLGLFKSCDIYLSGSRFEGFGYPIIEAMSQGTTVCSTDAGGNREFCIDGETALVSPRDNAGLLYRNLSRLLDDGTLRDRISRNGVNKTKEFVWKESLDRLAEYFISIKGDDCKRYSVKEQNIREEKVRAKDKALFIYSKDPFVKHKDWVNVEETVEYISGRGSDITSRLFIDRHPSKFVKARMEMLLPPERLRAFKCNVFYYKKIKLRLPLLPRVVFAFCNIADLASGIFLKDKKYSCVITAGGVNILLKFLCRLLNIRFYHLNFNADELAGYNFDHYNKDDLQKEKCYRGLIDKMLEATLADTRC